ncbi:hypothetical protein C8F01DRAFT_1224744 [Mycena amicta]|nr:hypothetical protein C8F01DRAFT_1224744 [Mycena amicta]
MFPTSRPPSASSPEPRANPLKRPASPSSSLSAPRVQKKRRGENAFCPICHRRFANYKSRNQHINGAAVCLNFAETHRLLPAEDIRALRESPQAVEKLRQTTCSNTRNDLADSWFRLHPNQHAKYLPRAARNNYDSHSDPKLVARPTQPQIVRPASTQVLHSGYPPLRREPAFATLPLDLPAPRRQLGPMHAGPARPWSGMPTGIPASFPIQGPIPRHIPFAFGPSQHHHVAPANPTARVQAYAAQQQQQHRLAFNEQRQPAALHTPHNPLPQTNFNSLSFGGTQRWAQTWTGQTQIQSQWVAHHRQHPLPQQRQNFEGTYNGYYDNMTSNVVLNPSSRASYPARSAPSPSLSNSSLTSPFGALDQRTPNSTALPTSSQSYYDDVSPAQTSEAYTPSSINSIAEEQREVASPAPSPWSQSTDLPSGQASIQPEQNTSARDAELPDDIEDSLAKLDFQRRRAFGITQEQAEQQTREFFEGFLLGFVPQQPPAFTSTVNSMTDSNADDNAQQIAFFDFTGVENVIGSADGEMSNGVDLVDGESWKDKDEESQSESWPLVVPEFLFGQTRAVYNLAPREKT